MENEDLIGTRRDIRFERITDPAPRTALAKALDRDINDPSIDFILKAFEGHLIHFLYRALETNEFFLNDSRIREDHITAALSKVSAFAKSLRKLNQTERHAVRQLIHRRLNPNSTASGISKSTIEDVLEICSKASFTKLQITKPERIVRTGRSGKTSDPANEQFAAAVRKIWEGQGFIVDRSKNRGGVLNLTRLLASCFNAELVLLKKFDSDGKAYPTESQPVLGKIEMSGIAASLLGRMSTDIRRKPPVAEPDRI